MQQRLGIARGHAPQAWHDDYIPLQALRAVEREHLDGASSGSRLRIKTIGEALQGCPGQLLGIARRRERAQQRTRIGQIPRLWRKRRTA